MTLEEAIYTMKLETVHLPDKLAGRDVAGSRKLVAEVLRAALPLAPVPSTNSQQDVEALAQRVESGATLSNADWAMLETVLEHR